MSLGCAVLSSHPSRPLNSLFIRRFSSSNSFLEFSFSSLVTGFAIVNLVCNGVTDAKGQVQLNWVYCVSSLCTLLLCTGLSYLYCTLLYKCSKVSLNLFACTLRVYTCIVLRCTIYNVKPVYCTPLYNCL